MTRQEIECQQEGCNAKVPHKGDRISMWDRRRAATAGWTVEAEKANA